MSHLPLCTGLFLTAFVADHILPKQWESAPVGLLIADASRVVSGRVPTSAMCWLGVTLYNLR